MTYDILTGYNVWHWSEIFNWSKISVESGVTFYNLSNLSKYIGVSLNCRITSREDKGDREGIPRTHPIP